MHTPPCLLVVDDQPMNVDILCSRLAVHGYEVLMARTGDEALALATARQPDLLLLDVMLPTMDGLAVCRQLKAEAAVPFLPILMISAKTAVPDILAGFRGRCRRLPHQAGGSSRAGGPGAGHAATQSPP